MARPKRMRTRTAAAAAAATVIAMVLFSSSRFVQCQLDGADYSNPAVLELLTEALYTRLTNLTTFMSTDLRHRSEPCIKDPEADWGRAFNFSSNLDFLTSCIQKTRGDVTQRLCTAAEVKFYFSNLFEGGSGSNYLKPNKNCNLTSWVSGCEPGWGCSVGPNQNVDLKNSQDMPIRKYNCRVCCEGFFCPHGITCMIPCPLGSYCPIATLNRTTGICEPYNYQLPPKQLNHTCGGANTWADVGRNSELFCSAGSYCPTTTKKIPCSSGHYCRMGSTSEKRCFKLTSCNPNTSNQYMHAYGAMITAALGTLLLIIYNFSDQAITTRARKQAKTREAAARSAKETARAHEKWKSAMNAAKKHAFQLQTQLSGKLSLTRSPMQSRQLPILGHAESKTEESPSFYQQSPFPVEGKRKEPIDLMKMMHKLEDDGESFEGFNVDIGDGSSISTFPKEKQRHTHSQIFRHAYAQLEKEKALEQQNKDLTFSEVVSMAAPQGIRKRPIMEVSFTDLTVILKGKNRFVLRCVTGNIKPGHITAVMGPSGAGKTTFLSTLAGKASGCRTSGLILINGKAESIHSYKKIVGFVPQDDIVHGNLTVAENIWFSARCSDVLYR